MKVLFLPYWFTSTLMTKDIPISQIFDKDCLLNHFAKSDLREIIYGQYNIQDDLNRMGIDLGELHLDICDLGAGKFDVYSAINGISLHDYLSGNSVVNFNRTDYRMDVQIVSTSDPAMGDVLVVTLVENTEDCQDSLQLSIVKALYESEGSLNHLAGTTLFTSAITHI